MNLNTPLDFDPVEESSRTHRHNRRGSVRQNRSEQESSNNDSWRAIHAFSEDCVELEEEPCVASSSSSVNLTHNSNISIFPKINYTAGKIIHEDPYNSASENASSVLDLVDDAASSICIDDDDDLHTRYQNAINTVREQPATEDDFAAYNRKVASEFIVKAKEQKLHRKRPRAVDVRDSRQYGNYFTINSSAAAESLAYTPSYQLDNFDGKRQLTSYNHQLNVLNSPYTYEEQVRRRKRQRQGLQGIPEDRDEYEGDESLFTLDVDDLEVDSDTDFLDRRGDHFQSHKLRRGLVSRQLRIMSLCGAVGIGVFLQSGQTFFMAGPLGTLLGYFITGLMVMSAMSCFGEMRSLLPSDGGVSGLMSRLVDDSLGFSIGICYWFSCAMALPTEITAASMLVTYYPKLSLPDHSIAVWTIFFLVLVMIVSLFEVRMWGELQYVFSLFTLVIIVIGYIFFLSLNNGDVGPLHDRVGFRYWDSSKSEPLLDRIYGPFRPFYVLNIEVGKDNSIEVTDSIGGNLGRFLQLWYAICNSIFSYVGTEVVFMTSGEVRNPRKALPAAAKVIFFRVMIFFVFAIFVVGINLYTGDTRLMGLSKERLMAGTNTVYNTGLGGCVTGHTSWDNSGDNSNSSPWIIALQSARLCTVASIVNSFAIFFTLTSGVAHLYAGSRTLYGLGTQHKLFKPFTKCSIVGVPYVSILFTALFALLAFLNLSQGSSEVFDWLSNLCASSVVLLWAAVCLAFIRFYNALKLRSDIRSRSDVLYPYRSLFQPYTAYFGLISSCIIELLLGLPLFLHGTWNTRTFISTYITLIAFVVFYTVHKLIWRNSLVPLDQIDLDTGRKEVENMEWEEDRVYRHDLKSLLWNIYTRFKRLRL